MKRKLLFVFLSLFLLSFFYKTPEAAAQQPCVAVAGDSIAYGDAVFQVIPVGIFPINLGPFSNYLESRLAGVKVYNDSVAGAVLNSSYIGSSGYNSLLSQKCQYNIIVPFVNDLNYRNPSSLIGALSSLSKNLLQGNPNGKIIIVKYYHTDHGDQVGFPEYKQNVATGFETGNINNYNNAISAACANGAFGNSQSVICIDPGVLSTVTGNDAPNEIRGGATKINGDQVHLNSTGKNTLASLLVAQMNFSSTTSTITPPVSSGTTPVQVQEPIATEGDIDYQCVGTEVAKYMNAVLNAPASRRPHIKFLSPAFNLTSRFTPEIWDAMVKAGAQFSDLFAFAGNTYTIAGKGAYSWYQEKWKAEFAKYGKDVVFTEYGDFNKNISSMKEEFGKASGDGSVTSALYFNALGINPEFSQFKLTSSEMASIVSGGNADKAGANSATYISGDSFPKAVKTYNSSLGWTLEIIAQYEDINKTVDSVRAAHSLGLKPVIRLCVGDTCGFSDPMTLAAFLTDLDSQINNDVYVIIGPNEPDIEMWASPNCRVRQNKFVPNEIACSDTGRKYSDQFHSLRPFPASPCNKNIEDTALFCGNQFVVKKSFKNLPASGNCFSNSDGSQTCRYNITGITADVSVDLSKAQLPILGNTELVPNSTDVGKEGQRGFLSDLTKVNEYVSWYLNGVIYRAEESDINLDLASDINKLINFSGPLRKLLPVYLQTTDRKQQVVDAGNVRHDQTAACYYSDKPASCVKDASYSQQNLVDWRKIAEKPGPVGTTLLEKGLIPSLPPDERDPRYQNFADYWVDYLVWRGHACTALPIFGFTCDNFLDMLLNRDFFTLERKKNANLFPYIPYSSTEDRKGQVQVAEKGIGTQTDAETAVTNITFTPVSSSHSLYFAHAEETNQLANLLQGTFASKDQPWVGAQTQGPPSIPPGCEIADTRTNQGDDLYGEINRDGDKQISGSISFDTSFSCKIEPAKFDQSCYDTCVKEETQQSSSQKLNVSQTSLAQVCRNICTKGGGCTKDVFAGVSVYTKTPEADELWQRLISGPMGVFKRFFPKTGADSVLTEIKDIPASTNATYLASGEGIQALAGNPTLNRTGTQAKLYFPHIGSLSEYFLKGIQKALRPKGFDNSVLSGQNESTGAVPPTSCKITCNQSVPDSEIPPLYSRLKNNFVDIAARWTGRTGKNYASECYNDVVNRSLAANVNPFFTLMIWLNESGASNYTARNTSCQTQDFGINDSSLAGPANFDQQITQFLKLPYSSGYMNCMAKLSPGTRGFLYRFRGCGEDTSAPWYKECKQAESCTLANQAGLDYFDAILKVWSTLGTGCPFPQNPTDMCR